MNGLIAVLAQLNEINRRLAGADFSGRVKEVDGSKHMARAVIGETPEGDEVLSPWVPIGQEAGDMKFHNMPSVGQQVSLRSYGGDIERARIVPLHWSEGYESPSDDPALKRMTYGPVLAEWDDSHVKISVGSMGIEITASEAHFFGPKVTHDEKDIGKTHKHEEAGGTGLSGLPWPR